MLGRKTKTTSRCKISALWVYKGLKYAVRHIQCFMVDMAKWCYRVDIEKKIELLQILPFDALNLKRFCLKEWHK